MIASKSSKAATSHRTQPTLTAVLLSDAHLAELMASGLSREQALATGHRSVTAAEAKKATGHDLPGLLFSYQNPLTGKPYEILTGKWAKRPFCRLKPDWAAARSQQREHYADSEGKLPKYLSPSKCGSRPYFSPLIDWGKVLGKSSIPIILTEGEKKGDAGCAAGIPTIALSGVSAFVDRDDRDEWTAGEGSGWDCEEPEDGEPRSRFLPELDIVQWAHRAIGVAFDSDISSNFFVEKSLETLLAHTRARVGRGYPIVLPTEVDGKKNGLDDFIARHGSAAFLMLANAYQSIQGSNRKMVVYKKAKDGGTKVLGGRDKEGKPHTGELRCFLSLKEPPSHVRALAAWSVLKEDWAYRPGLGWYNWNGKCWAASSDALQLGAEITKFFDSQNWQDRNGGQYAYTAEEMARRTIISEDRWAGENKISFQNGTLDTQSNEFHPHRREDFCTSALPYDYDPLAQCPTWLNFLEAATGGDHQLQQLIRAWFRWIVAPKDRRYKFPVEKSLDLIGRKGTGKGTLLDVLVQLVGEDNCGSAAPDTFGSPEGLGQLIDKKIAIDADATGYMAGVGNFNKVVSNEAVSVKKLFKDKATLRLGVVVVRAYNDYVQVPSSGTEGLDRRLCPIPFKYPPATPDYRLSEKLQGELAGIFAWAWSMSLASARSVIRWSGAIDAVQDAAIDRFCNDHPEYRYLLDYYPAGHDKIQAFDLYTRYVEWAKGNGHKACSNTKFGILMSELGIVPIKGDGGCHFYTIPNMEKKFDLVGYLRISPGDPEGLPDELRPQNALNPLPVKASEGLEGFGGLKEASNPEPARVPEGSEGFGGESSTTIKNTPKKDPSPGDIVLICAGATRYNHQSSELPYPVPARIRDASTCRLSELPQATAALITGESEVLGLLDGGEKIRVCSLEDSRIISVFDLEQVRLLRARSAPE